MKKPKVCIHWFRRDLRLNDNHGLFKALSEHGDVLPLFIFDTDILDKLERKDDRRVDFLHRTLEALQRQLISLGSTILVEYGKPEQVLEQLLDRYNITAVTVNHDHEPYAIQRDARIAALLGSRGVAMRSFKDISIFERSEVTKEDGNPYTVFTPYARKWRTQLTDQMLEPFPSGTLQDRFHQCSATQLPTLGSMGFQRTDLDIPGLGLDAATLANYRDARNIPSVNGTSRMSTHLRFGTVSVRELARKGQAHSPTYLNELIWREFFMQILWHFPHSEKAFKPAYDNIPWRPDEEGFRRWCEGRTGYPLVDAGMRELDQTGLMHNRVRMVVASFLTKHLLIDWRWGEAHFAARLLDFELSSNNGGWQWASGSGCDAAPYFRVFNPQLQQERFDPALNYVKKWVPEYGTGNYPSPLVVHEVARKRAIETYKTALSSAVKRNDQQTTLFA